MPPMRKPARFLLLEVYKELGRISGAGAGLGRGCLPAGSLVRTGESSSNPSLKVPGTPLTSGRNQCADDERADKGFIGRGVGQATGEWREW